MLLEARRGLQGQKIWRWAEFQDRRNLGRLRSMLESCFQGAVPRQHGPLPVPSLEAASQQPCYPSEGSGLLPKKHDASATTVASLPPLIYHVELQYRNSEPTTFHAIRSVTGLA